MSYPVDLDEMDEEKIRCEIGRREELRARGLCDYCGRDHTQPSCKFPARHYRVQTELRAKHARAHEARSCPYCQQREGSATCQKAHP